MSRSDDDNKKRVTFQQELTEAESSNRWAKRVYFVLFFSYIKERETDDKKNQSAVGEGKKWSQFMRN